MKILLKALFVIILLVFTISSSCDKGFDSEVMGCMDGDACNPTINATIDDGSCWYPIDGCLCEDGIGAKIDCLGVCDLDENNNPPIDIDGSCCSSISDMCSEIVIGGCIEDSKCNYNINANYNDNSCIDKDLTLFGGNADGTDCNDICGGSAVWGGDCDKCIGGNTGIGNSWRIKIYALASFALIDSSTEIENYLDSIILGASYFALDGYNNVHYNDDDINCEDCYIDFPKGPNTGFENTSNYIRFFFPYDNKDESSEEWSNWGSKVQFSDYSELYFSRDIRYNDYYSLLTNEVGLNWYSEISPHLSDTTIEDSSYQVTLNKIKLYYNYNSFNEGLNNVDIKVYLGREKNTISGGVEYTLSDTLMIPIESRDKISITFNISNICFDEFIEFIY